MGEQEDWVRAERQRIRRAEEEERLAGRHRRSLLRAKARHALDCTRAVRAEERRRAQQAEALHEGLPELEQAHSLELEELNEPDLHEVWTLADRRRTDADRLEADHETAQRESGALNHAGAGEVREDRRMVERMREAVVPLVGRTEWNVEPEPEPEPDPNLETDARSSTTTMQHRRDRPLSIWPPFYPLPDNPTVYVTATGKCYHWRGCHLGYIPVGRDDAISRGYLSCSRCFPPRGPANPIFWSLLALVTVVLVMVYWKVIFGFFLFLMFMSHRR